MPKIIEELPRVLPEPVDHRTRLRDLEEYAKALGVFSQLPQNTKVLWNDGPRLKALDQKLERKAPPDQMGKGRNVWFCMGYALGSNDADAVAIHDCDITTYDRSLLARLLYPVAHPQFNYEFCGYYARVADGKINGRVSRLLVTPPYLPLSESLGHSSI